jgi:hypothetical protein
MTALTIAAVWIVCSVLSYGISYAFFSKEFPTLYEPRLPNIVFSLLGPMTLIALVIFLLVENGMGAFKHGLKF